QRSLAGACARRLPVEGDEQKQRDLDILIGQSGYPSRWSGSPLSRQEQDDHDRGCVEVAYVTPEKVSKEAAIQAAERGAKQPVSERRIAGDPSVQSIRKERQGTILIKDVSVESVTRREQLGGRKEDAAVLGNQAHRRNDGGTPKGEPEIDRDGREPYSQGDEVADAFIQRGGTPARQAQ